MAFIFQETHRLKKFVNCVLCFNSSILQHYEHGSYYQNKNNCHVKAVHAWGHRLLGVKCNAGWCESGIKLTLTGVESNTNLVWSSHNTGVVKFNTRDFAVLIFSWYKLLIYWFITVSSNQNQWLNYRLQIKEINILFTNIQYFYSRCLRRVNE